jgi:hypothetical protein
VISAESLPGFLKPLSDPGRSNEVTLRHQKRQFVHTIKLPQVFAELQAVEDGDWLHKTDVFRPKVAVPVDDAALLNSLVEHCGIQMKQLQLEALCSQYPAVRKVVRSRQKLVTIPVHM